MHSLTLKNSIQHNLDTFSSIRVASETGLTRAAVALVVSRHSQSEEACIYLTLRSSKLRKHAGQYALPGGKLDANETSQQAAVRELCEELGIILPESSVLGMLDDFQTRSGFSITPVVLWNDAITPLQPNPDEVARCYEIPLEELRTDDLLNTTDTMASSIFSISPASVGTCIYSPTAAIIFQFAEVALHGRESRVNHYEQPSFAWQ